MNFRRTMTSSYSFRFLIKNALKSNSFRKRIVLKTLISAEARVKNVLKIFNFCRNEFVDEISLNEELRWTISFDIKLRYFSITRYSFVFLKNVITFFWKTFFVAIDHREKKSINFVELKVWRTVVKFVTTNLKLTIVITSTMCFNSFVNSLM